MSDTKTLPQRLRQLAPHVAIVALGREGFEAMEAMREAADRIEALEAALRDLTATFGDGEQGMDEAMAMGADAELFAARALLESK